MQHIVFFISFGLVALASSFAVGQDDVGPKFGMEISNREFGYSNTFILGPGKSKGVATYRWFGTNEIQEDELDYEKEIQFTLPSNELVEAWLYRGYDIEGDEWWLAFEKSATLGPNKARIFFSFDKDAETYKEWLVPGGSDKRRLSENERFSKISELYGFDLKLVRRGFAENAMEKFEIQEYWKALRGFRNDYLGELIWYSQAGNLKFAVTDRESQAFIEKVLGGQKLPISSTAQVKQQTTELITSFHEFDKSLFVNGKLSIAKCKKRVNETFPPPQQSSVGKAIARLPNGTVNRLTVQSDFLGNNLYQIHFQPSTFYRSKNKVVLWRIIVRLEILDGKEIKSTISTVIKTKSSEAKARWITVDSASNLVTDGENTAVRGHTIWATIQRHGDEFTDLPNIQSREEKTFDNFINLELAIGNRLKASFAGK